MWTLPTENIDLPLFNTLNFENIVSRQFEPKIGSTTTACFMYGSNRMVLYVTTSY